MNISKYRYPIDNDQFQEIREQGMLYVDKTDIFVLELKVDDTVENAIAQIDDKGYAIPYEADGRTVTKCGVSITSEHRNITHWRITDADGNILEDKNFLEKDK